MTTDQKSLVLCTKSPEGITTITINRPNSRNAVNHETSVLLANAFTSFEADDSQLVCIFTGVGNFAAGYDLHEVAQNASGHPLAEPVDKGHAVAGGLELSLLGDIRVADTSAVFGVFCRRFGVPLLDGGTVRLPKIIGMGRAMDMILTGRPVNADEALSFGLVNRVVEKGSALDAAMEVARGLLKFPQKRMRADKAAAHYSVYEATSMEDALRFEFETGRRVIKEESVPGAARFSKGEGRKGSFEIGKL